MITTATPAHLPGKKLATRIRRHMLTGCAPRQAGTRSSANKRTPLPCPTRHRPFGTRLDTVNKTVSIFLASLVAILCLNGCGNARRELTGKWRPSSGTNSTVWEFRANGGVTMGSIQGRYTFGDRDRIKIETGSSTALYELSVAGDHMTLTDPRGTKLEFVRVSP